MDTFQNTNTFRPLFPQYKPLAMFLSFMLVACTIYRVSAFPYFAGSWSSRLAMMGQYGLLVVSSVYLISSMAGGVNGIAVLLPLMTFMSIFTTGDTTQAGIRWAGWFMLFIAVGPLVRSAKAVQFRENLWRTWRFITVPIALGSFFYYFAPLPRVGRGLYSGLMGHSMLLGPISAMATVTAVVIARRMNKRMGTFMVACIMISCFFSGSRSAMACCLMAAAATYVLSGERVTSSVGALLIAFLVIGMSYQSIIGVIQGTATGQYLKQKGTRNTRSKKWETRINEFKAHPIFGVGINMAMELDEDEPGAKKARAGVESGSSWLSFLSMTGLAGSMAYLALMASILAKFVRNWKRVSPFDRAEAAGITLFLGLHTVFEGYALAFGSPLSLIFWMAWGRMVDLANRA